MKMKSEELNVLGSLKLSVVVLIFVHNLLVKSVMVLFLVKIYMYKSKNISCTGMSILTDISLFKILENLSLKVNKNT